MFQFIVRGSVITKAGRMADAMAPARTPTAATTTAGQRKTEKLAHSQFRASVSNAATDGPKVVSIMSGLPAAKKDDGRHDQR